MADTGFATDYDLQRQQLARRRAIAEAQLAQSMKPAGDTQMVSGRAVPMSPLAPIARIAQAYMAQKGIEGANQEEKQIGQNARDQIAQALSEYQTAVTPRAAVPGGVDESGFDVHPAVPAYTPGVEDKRQAAFRLMSASGVDPRDTAKLIVANALKGPQTGNVEPKDYTPESYAAYVRTGDVTLLRAAQKPEATPSALKEYEYAKGQGYTGTLEEWLTGQKKAGATNVNISTEKKYGEQFGSLIAKADVDMRDAALKAPNLADRANRIKQALSTGKVITGTGADVRLALGKALNLVGASDSETVANTETLATQLAQNTLDAIKASGLGSGTGFSNADRDFLEKAVGGKITLQAETISRLADLAHRAASQSATRWSERVKKIPKDALEGTGITTEQIAVPALFGSQPASMVSPETRRLLDQYAPEGQ